MAYDAYEQFIAAAKKFPRWTNIRRRPTESVGGKILRSIIEEIAAVEDAILEYKKDFFLVNYVGREEEIADYLYAAQVGDITDLDALTLIDPYYNVTDDEGLFYQDKTYAYYQNGYLILWNTNTTNTLTYSYNDFEYTAALTSVAIWNVFDEFAWWYGLERFPNERNASLMQRCLYQFQRRPNSTEEGIRNAILNAAHAKDDVIPGGSSINRLEADEVKFLEPNEVSMARQNNDRITLYEEISRFNRDIARTRQWDMDYWDNAFRKLRYLPHVWDAEMDICQNGVGYHDALQVTTLDKIDQEGSTNINVYGYKESAEEIESYVSANQIYQNVVLSLKKYGDTIKPLPVQYKVTAEDLIPVEEPENINFSFYKQYTGEQTYPIDEFIKTWDGAERERNNQLSANTEYKLTFSGNDDTPIEISKCNLIAGSVATDLLEEQPDYGFIRSGNRIINNRILFHGTKLIDFSSPTNLEDCLDQTGGIKMTKPLQPSTFQIPLKHEAFSMEQQLAIEIDPDTGWNKLGYGHPYLMPTGFTYEENEEFYLSKDTGLIDDVFKIKARPYGCRRIKLRIDAVNPNEQALVEIQIKRGDTLLSKDRVDVQNGYDLSFEQEGSNLEQELTVEIKRYSAPQILIRDIYIQSYDFTIEITDGTDVLATIPYQEKIQMLIPGGTGTRYLRCTLQNIGNPASPIIKYIHIGPYFKNLNYVLTFTTTAISSLEIETNANVTLVNKTLNRTVSDFDFQYKYKAKTGKVGVLALDLSDFESIYYTKPALKKDVIHGENAYYITVKDGDEPIRNIIVCGTRYRFEQTKTLADIVSGTDLYYARSANGFIKKTGQNAEIITIQRDDIPYGDKVVITDPQHAITACFITGNQVRHVTNTFTGVYESVYLFKEPVQQYIAYGTDRLTRSLTKGIKIPTSFLPIPEPNPLLWYQISLLSPNTGIDIYFSDDETRLWSVDPTESLTIYVHTYENMAEQEPDIFETEADIVSQNVLLSNHIDLSDFENTTFRITDLGRYIITPPDGMEVIYSDRVFQQVADENGETIYVKEDGFNKLYHSNIVSINRIKVGSIIYTTQEAIQRILTLLPEEGIICWNGTGLQGSRIEQIDYTYRHPDALRYVDLNALYNKVGYEIPASSIVNKQDYELVNKKDGDVIPVDSYYFSETPSWIAAVCTNPCYYAYVSDNKIYVKRIAEDKSPVVHNGFYYMDGKEYYFFSKRYEQDLDRMEGMTVDNGEVTGNKLYLYKEAVNYLENSRMDRNKLDVHCVVDFKKPRTKTNIDPLGHIGACEVFTAWHDYNAERTLTTYKNGLATQFTIQDNGYSLFDITRYLIGHTTISCLYSGNLTFQLAREIRIMGQQALKAVYCEPIASFQKHQDVAYCISDNLDTATYRYYLIVTGNGILDEVLIHDLTDLEAIQAYHTKAIDKLGFTVTEKEKAASRFVTMEYSSDFMRYYQAETDTDTSLRTGANVDWNITKLQSYDLSTVRTTNMLYRSGALLAQKDGAVIETKPVEIKHRRSVKRLALKVNQLMAGAFKNFSISVLASALENGVYTEIAKQENGNLAVFTIQDMNRYLKFRITASENQIITTVDLLAEYRESAVENLSIYDYTEGSAVTKVFDIGTVGNYRFNRVICETGYDDYASIHIRGAKLSQTGEYVWSEWKDTANHPELYGYRLFQYKIRLDNKKSRLRIKEFEFEVL